MIDGADPMAYLVNPDAWIKIPEFGVMPSEVNYEGFSFPVIHATVNPFSVNLMKLIGTARTLARREFKTLKGLRETYQDALGVMRDDATESTSTPWTERQSASVVYSMFMLYIEAARAPVPTSPFNINKHEALSDAAVLITNWAMNGAKEAAKQISKRNAGNASMPRPKARDPLRERVKAIIGRERNKGHSLDEALHGWQNDQIDGLRLTYDREKNVYVVDDENAVEMVFKTFTDRQLRTIFTESILPG